MLKILKSVMMIGVVAAIALGVTGAYFSDTETSSGNTFTAGAIDLKVDNHCWLNGNECLPNEGYTMQYAWHGDNPYPEPGTPCSCTWGPTDLTNELFANFTDLKPGDLGEDTISFHVNSNDAWLCANVNVVEDNDVTCTEPETESTDPSCQNNQVGDGELDNYLEVFAWVDVCATDEATPGDNIYQPNCDEPLTTEGPVALTNYYGTFPLADSNFSIVGYDANGKGLPVAGNEDYFIGKAWCFGDMTVEGGTISCDGKPVQNDAQTDKLKLDVSFEAVQARNNDNFVCADYYFGKEYTLELENKDSNWDPISDNTKGTLTFKSPYPTFNGHLTVQGLQANTNYSLIYYKGDPYPAVGSIRIAEFATDGSGNAEVDVNKDIGTDLHSAKIWVILSSDWYETNHKMAGWHPDKYLFEMNLIDYDDSNI